MGLGTILTIITARDITPPDITGGLTAIPITVIPIGVTVIGDITAGIGTKTNCESSLRVDAT